MANFSIGISGLTAAQKAFDVIGNNIANAATEGYHRQRIELSPAYTSHIGSLILGGGVDVTGVTRMINTLLEQEILRQQSLLEQVNAECDSLRTIETTFGELSTKSGLNAVLDDFFNALADLNAHPGNIIWQKQAVSSAETLAIQFRALDESLTMLETRIKLEAENMVERINSLINQIAQLNKSIQEISTTGGQPHNLCDQRDQYISELSELVGVETVVREYGVTDVIAAGIPVAIGFNATEVEVALQTDGKLGISIAGAESYNTNIQGGYLGGLFSLKNDIVPDIHNDLDSLASAIIQQINQYHVQGVGSYGSFTELTGWAVSDPDEKFADYTNPSVSDGSIFIRITNTSTAAITREEVTITAANDSLTSLASSIDLLTGVDASVVSSKLYIAAEAGYKFDFLPGASPQPETTDFAGATDPPTVSVSGIYKGSSNDTLTFTVSGAGDVGNGSLTLTVENAALDPVATLNIGSGYAAGDEIDVGDTGIKISLTTGDFAVNNNFTVDVYADTDTSKVLSALGINTLFSGYSASDIAVCEDISATPSRIATALGVDMTGYTQDINDNANAARMASLKDQSLSSLNSLTPGEYYRKLVVDIGLQMSVKQMRKENIEAITRNLANQQGETSGVNINDEATQLLIFEQMFQAMAKYISTLQSTMSSLMETM